MLALALLLVLVVGLERVAQAEPTSLTGTYSRYEKVAIADAKRSFEGELDPNPEGKRIARIDFMRLDPIDDHDGLPIVLDAAHPTSKEYTIRRALFVREGDAYRKVLVDESARSLRRLRQLSTVVIVPFVGSSPGTVRLVVITKDVWSLYPDFDIALTGGGLESLTLEPKETNIAGTHHVGTARFVLEPQTMTFGGSYEIPRLEDRWLALTMDANAVINRESGDLEGGYGQSKIERPLFSTRTEWAWSMTSIFSNRVRRRYTDGKVAMYQDASGAIPWAWREHQFKEELAITRSFGWAAKNDISFGASLAHTSYAATADASRFPQVAPFTRAAVPIGEDRVGPYVEWRSYRSDFLRTYDLAGLALQEDHRLGHEVGVRAYPILRALGSTRDVLGTIAGAAYTVPLGNGLARAAVDFLLESQVDRISDGAVKGAFAIASPRFPLGRLVYAVNALHRFENYLNVQSYLGGDTLLRGYPTRYLVGKDTVTSNLELRTRSIKLPIVEAGLVAFYDVGDAYSSEQRRLDPKQSLGGGLRLVFPQIDRSVFRIDVGAPVGDVPAGVGPVSFFVAFHQALALPPPGAFLQ